MENLLLDSSSSVESIFSQYIEKQSVFKNKNVLTSSFIPDKILHREEETKQLSLILAPILKGFHSNNIFIYGKCGTGKTMCSRYVLQHLEAISKKNNIQEIKTIYLNCKMKRVADTEYRLLTQLLKELGEVVPDTGLPTDVLYRRFFEKIEETEGSLIIILDEIDALFKKIGDEFLYNLTRINSELKRNHITLLGITNDLSFKDALDSRVRSSLNEEEIIFKPYDALQLKSILLERVKHGFIDGVISDDVLTKCAAISAQEHGDVRRALDLLVVAGEIAERIGNNEISERHLDMAEEKINMDRITEAIKIQPMQSRAVLYAIIRQYKKNSSSKKWVDNRLLTGDIFNEYVEICKQTGMKILTQRRISDLITELDMLGIISTRVISNGRYGRTREILLTLNQMLVDKIEKMLISELV